MAIALLNAKIWVGRYDLTGDHNQISVEKGFEEADVTTFGHGARAKRGTLPFVQVSGGGFNQFGANGVHSAIRGQLNVANVPFTVSPTGGADGDYAETFLARIARVQTLGQVGQMIPFTFSAESQGVPAVDGTILGVGAKTATANGTGRQLGALASGYSLFAALHVFSVSGSSPTLDMIVQSDDNAGFTSATTRLTFAQKVAVGSEWLSLTTPVTDDYWRAAWTIGGTGTPTFDLAVIVGIVANP